MSHAFSLHTDCFYQPGRYLTSPCESFLAKSQLQVPIESAVDTGTDSETPNQKFNTMSLIPCYGDCEEIHVRN